MQLTGIKADLVDVEVDISRGLHSFSIVGLPDKSVNEAQDRINAAIKNSGFKPPHKGNKKVVVSLAPAEIKKEGSAYDLSIALGCLLANQDVVFDPKDKIFIGELALSGELRPIKGALVIAGRAKELGFKEIYLPEVNAIEAALVRDIEVYGCKNLKQIVHFLDKELSEQAGDALTQILAKQPPTNINHDETIMPIDFSDVKGQSIAKRGLEIAAAGGHNIAMYGPPGTGKTMLAKAFAGILPPLSYEDIIEVTGIHSAAGNLANDDLIVMPPIRSPHHTSSYVSLVGGGAWPKPGEITMAHRGVLFLDEFPEFDKRVIEALRQPLEDRIINVSRAKGSITFPANFILIAAMNPCPCGNKGSRERECTCPQGTLQKYERKISGPIVDRIDLWVEVPYIAPEKLSSITTSESSREVRERIEKAREIQARRFTGAGQSVKTNSDMGAKEIKTFIILDPASEKILNDSARIYKMSARSYHRVLKIARTIADLAGDSDIKQGHLLEALQYRPKVDFNS